MRDPCISVIVPVYKVEAYLSRCVDSILCQTFRDIEVILIDDGSPDRCGNMCDGYAKQDRRVHVIHKSNGGLSSARNAGLEQTHGRFISFVDSDDWIDADMLELLYNTLQRHNAQIAECSYRRIYADRICEETSCSAACMEGDSLFALEGMLDWKYFKPVVWNKLYARSVIGDIRFPVGKLHEDEFTTYKFFYHAHKLVYADISKYNYNCTRTDSITNTRFDENHLDGCFALRERIDFFREHGITSLEEKMNNIYLWTTLDHLQRAYHEGLQGEKVQKLLAQLKRDAEDFADRPLHAEYRRKLDLIAQEGMNAFKICEEEAARAKN